MFLKNCWYMSGWSPDFEADKITPRRLIGIDLIFYRKTNNELIVMEDKCCHRMAPLSIGQQEGDDIRCMYHGIKFGPDGQCTEIPTQKRIPKNVCVKTYPVVERHGSAWVWMGDPALADADKIPNFIGPDTDDWAMLPDRKYMNINYQLMNDNLLDLSHVAYVHRNSFGQGDTEASSAFAKIPSKTTKYENGVRVERWVTGQASPPYIKEILNEPNLDYYTWYDFVAPGIFLLNTRIYPLGYIEKYGDDLINQAHIFAEYSCQAVTPIDEDNICYYFALGPWAKHAELQQMYLDLGHMAFGEDQVMLEKQYAVMKRNPDVELMNLAADQSIVTFRSIMADLKTKEA